MSINKATEDTLKGLAKFLKTLSTADGLDDIRRQARALSKDLTQARANIKAATAEISTAGIPVPSELASFAQVFDETPVMFVSAKQLATNSPFIGRKTQAEQGFEIALYKKLPPA